ncbi:hypothetical protein CJ469_06072 [Nocardia farcinica]|nr:hypothetical protein CJ469_06072 [Nocardia farcinica]PFX03230.1 hypothetical protein CJ468_05689 [Nocardia farcinica]
MTRLSRNHLLYQYIRDAGWTYEEVADKINDLVERSTGRRGLYTGDSVLRLVNGSVSWPHLRYREALCQLFGVAPGQLGLANPRTTSVRVKEVDVDRQEFLRTLAAVPVIAALPAPQPTIRSTERNVPRCVGIEHAQRVNAWAEEFRQGDDAGNGAFEGMTVQLVRAREFLQATMPPPVERELKAAVATLHRVVGWARYDRGDHAGALNDWNEGYDLIGDDGPRWLRAALLTCMARQAIYLGHLDYALDKLGIAAIRADKLSLLRRADITAVKARAFGAQGNHRECVRAVTEAESLFNEAADEDHPDLAHEDLLQRQAAGRRPRARPVHSVLSAGTRARADHDQARSCTTSARRPRTISAAQHRPTGRPASAPRRPRTRRRPCSRGTRRRTRNYLSTSNSRHLPHPPTHDRLPDQDKRPRRRTLRQDRCAAG